MRQRTKMKKGEEKWPHNKLMEFMQLEIYALLEIVLSHSCSYPTVMSQTLSLSPHH